MENLKPAPLALEEIKPVKKQAFRQRKIFIFLGVAILILFLIFGKRIYSELSIRYCPGLIIVNKMPTTIEFGSTASPSTYWIKDGARREMSEYPKNAPFFCKWRKIFVT